MEMLLSVAAALLLSYGGAFGAETLLDRYATPESRASQLTDTELPAASVVPSAEEQFGESD